MKNILRDKVKAAQDRFIKNPAREQGNQELDRRELVQVAIDTIIDHVQPMNALIADTLDSLYTDIRALEKESESQANCFITMLKRLEALEQKPVKKNKVKEVNPND